ncbi:MAG TPA: hypothetical protein VGQ10_13790 [Vicinamibacterales bacterium]|jgi:hypothetical protein|nr:hypothetical protein [Vicinamibacterales bacterium]
MSEVSHRFVVLILMLCALAPRAQGQHTQTSPEDAAFLNEVRENLSRAEQLAHLYSYKERRTDVHANPFGRIGTGDTRVLEVYPSPNRQLTFRRVIERDGVPVPDAELREQEREYQQRATDIHARLSTEGFDARTARERDEAAARQRAKNRLDDILRVLVFNVKSHEVRNGVETVVVTFQGRPDAEPMTREGRMAKSFKGTIWIHDKARELMDVEAVTTDDIAFGGFIARISDGTRTTMTRREVAPGVWMPTRVTFNGEGRVLLFRKLKIDYLVEWFDYRKMTPGASVGGFDPGVER